MASSNSKMTIWDLPNSDKDAVIFLQKYGILPDVRKCTNSHPMKLYFGKQIFWKCNVAACNQHAGIRSDSWFEGSHMSLLTAVKFIYCWCRELTTVKFCAEELGLADKTVTDWNNYMTEICVLHMASKERTKIGGPGCVVEVDESSLKRRKNSSIRILPDQWILGGVCRETEETFLTIVPDRSALSLSEKIVENIEDGSTIYSDDWSAYQTDEMVFRHLRVDHKYSLVDPQTGVDAQTVGRMWGSDKWRNKGPRGTARHHLESHLAEFLWRQDQGREKKDCFDSILKSIALHFPQKRAQPPDTSSTPVLLMDLEEWQGMIKPEDTKTEEIE